MDTISRYSTDIYPQSQDRRKDKDHAYFCQWWSIGGEFIGAQDNVALSCLRLDQVRSTLCAAWECKWLKAWVGKNNLTSSDQIQPTVLDSPNWTTYLLSKLVFIRKVRRRKTNKSMIHITKQNMSIFSLPHFLHILSFSLLRSHLPQPSPR